MKSLAPLHCGRTPLAYLWDHVKQVLLKVKMEEITSSNHAIRHIAETLSSLSIRLEDVSDRIYGSSYTCVYIYIECMILQVLVYGELLEGQFNWTSLRGL